MAENMSGGARRKRHKKYLCGVPQAQCCGSQSTTAGCLKGTKSHSSTIEAFKCYANYLIRDGYKQVGPREFCKDDGPIIVLTKKIRFGAVLRGGKGERHMAKDFHGGTIIAI